MRRTRIIVSAMLAASMSAAGLVAVGTGSGATAPPGSRANPIKAKEAARGSFLPARVTVRNTRRGTTVYFRSTDRAPHNATPVRPIRGSVSTTTSTLFTLRLPAAYRGTFAYICTIHADMRGSLTVLAPR